MATSIKTYARNLARSAKYASVDVIKEIMPNTTEFMENNNDLFRDISATLRNRRIIFKKVNDRMTQSKMYDTFEETKRSIIEDVTSGKLYNKDPIRERRINKKSGMDVEGMGGIDDFDFDFEDDSFDFIDDDNGELAAAFDDSNRTTSEMVASTVAQTSANQIVANKMMNQMTLIQMQEGFGVVNRNLGNLGNTIAELGNSLADIHQTNAENAKTFYEKSTEFQSNMVTYLKELVDLKKKEMGISDTNNMVSSTHDQPKVLSDVVNYEGMPDLKAYGKYLSNKMTDSLSLISGMNSMGMDNGNMSMQLAMSPLSFIPKAIMYNLIGQGVKKSAQALDNTLSSVFSAFISSMNELSDDGGFLSPKGLIGNFFGMNDVLKTQKSIKTDYDKGNKSWNGRAEKALIEVIPTLLSKILAATSGKDEMTYNYDTGKFTTVSQIQKEFDNRIKNERDSAFYDIRNSMDSMMRSINLDFEDEDTKRDFQKDYDRFFKYFFDTNQRFNPNKKNYEDYIGLGISKDNYDIIEALFENLDPATKMSMDRKKLKGRESINSYIDNLTKNSPVFSILNNDSSLTSIVNDDKNINGFGPLSISKDVKGHNVFWYLENILDTLRNIPSFGNGRNKNRVRTNRNGENETQEDTQPTLPTQTSTRRNISDDALSVERLLYNRPEGTSISGTINNRIELANSERQMVDEEEHQTLIDDLLASDSLPEKAKTFFKGMKKTISSPKNAMIGLLDTVNLKIYQAMYGNKRYKGKDVNGIIGVMMENIEDSFTKVNTFLDERILSPLKNKLDEEGGLKGILKNTFGIDLDLLRDKFFGKESLFGRTIQNVKDDIKGAFNYSKDAVTGVYKDIYDKIGGNQYDSKFNKILNTIRYGKNNVANGFIINSEGQLNMLNQVKKARTNNNINEDGSLNNEQESNSIMESQMSLFAPDENAAINDAANSMGITPDIISRAINNGSIETYAKGGPIHETKIVMVHDGEEIITKEEKARRDREDMYNQRVSDHINKLKNTMSENFVGPLPLKDQKSKNLINSINDDNVQSIKDSLGKDFKATTADTLKEEIIEAIGHKKGDPTLVETMKDKASDGIGKAMNVLFGVDQNEHDDEKADDLKERGKKAVKDIFSKFKQYFPSAASGAVIGAGLGGVVGMPLLGAAVGSSINLVKKSDKLQSYLFGDMDDETKQRIGNGKLPKRLVDAMNKYAPDMKKYGITGAVTALLPFVPGGPVAGLLLGAGVGFAKNNAKMQDFLFGDTGILKGLKGKGEKLKKKLPGIGVGAGLLALTGPFGLVGNAVLGAGLGFAAQTNKFQEFLYGKDKGKKDDKGNPIMEGGFLPMLRDRVVDPIKKFGSSIGDKIKSFVDEEIRKPFHKAMSPFVEEFKMQGKKLFSTVKDGITSSINSIFERAVGKPLNQLIEEKIVDPVSGLFKKLFGFLGKFIGGILKTPAKIMGGAADALRLKHLKEGKAEYMTDEELAKLKEKHPMEYFQATFGKTFKDALANGSIFDLFKRKEKNDKDISEKQDTEQKQSFSERFKDKMASISKKYNETRAKMSEDAATNFAGVKDSIRNKAQNLKTKAYQSSANFMERILDKIQSNKNNREPEQQSESEGDSETQENGENTVESVIKHKYTRKLSKEKIITPESTSDQGKDINTNKTGIPEIDNLKMKVKQLTQELAIMQARKDEENIDDNKYKGKDSDNIKDIRDEVYGQLDGIGYNVHTIANILVERFGMPETEAKGSKVSRGNLIRQKWFERIFGFILNPTRKIKEKAKSLLWGKDGKGGLLGMPMKIVHSIYDKLTNVGSIITKGFGLVGKVGSGIVHGIGFLGTVFTESLKMVGPAIGSVLASAVKLLRVPIDLLSGAVNGLGKGIGKILEGVGFLGGKMIEFAGYLPSLIVGVGRLTKAVGSLIGRFAKFTIGGLVKIAKGIVGGLAGGIKSLFSKKKKDPTFIKYTVDGGFIDKVKEPIDINGAEERHEKLLSFFGEKFDRLFDILGNNKSDHSTDLPINNNLLPNNTQLSDEELSKMPYSDYIRSGQSMSISDLSKYADLRSKNSSVQKMTLRDLIINNKLKTENGHVEYGLLNNQKNNNITLPTEHGVIRFDSDVNGELRPIQDKVYDNYIEEKEAKEANAQKMLNLISTGDENDDGKGKKKVSWISKIASSIGSVLAGAGLLKVVGAGLAAGMLYDYSKNGENSFAGKFITLLTDKVIPAIGNVLGPIIIDAIGNGIVNILDRITNSDKYSNPNNELSKESVIMKSEDGSFITKSGKVYNNKGDLVVNNLPKAPKTSLELIGSSVGSIINNSFEKWTGKRLGDNSIIHKLFDTPQNVKEWQNEMNNISHPNEDVVTNNIETGKGKSNVSFFSQNDSRWSGIRFNNPLDTDKQTIADSGCGPTAAAMIANSYGRSNPVEASKYALDNGYKEQNGGTRPEFFKDYFKQKGIQSEIDTDVDNNVSKKQSIIDNLKNNKPVILMGKSKGGNTPYGNEYPHYVVATGMNGNNIEVNDPYSNRPGELYNAKDTLKSSTIGIKVKNGKGKQYGRIGSVQTSISNSNGSLSSGNTAFEFVKDITTTFTGAIGELFGVDLFNAGNSSSQFNYSDISGGVAVGSGQSFDPNVAVNVINAFFSNANTKLRNKGKVIVSIAQQACHESANGNNPGIDPFLLAAIIMQETGGDSAALRNKNNPGGVMRAGGGLRVFSTIEDGIMAVAKIIHREWIVKGNNTIAGLGNIYCPVGADNDPNGLNKHWVGGVTKFYNQLVQQATAAGGLMDSGSVVAKTGTANNNAVRIVNIARSYIGKVRYVFGATTPDKGVSDCSGFTQHVYKKVGINIGRNTEAQVTDKDTVKVSDSYNYKAQPGDLVFFKDTYNSGYIYGVSHVGICTGDGTKFIECNSSKGVCESDYTSNYCKQHFLMIRRHSSCVDKNKFGDNNQKQQYIQKPKVTSPTTILSNTGVGKSHRSLSDKISGIYGDYSNGISYGLGAGEVNLNKTAKTIPNIHKMINNYIKSNDSKSNIGKNKSIEFGKAKDQQTLSNNIKKATTVVKDTASRLYTSLTKGNNVSNNDYIYRDQQQDSINNNLYNNQLQLNNQIQALSSIAETTKNIYNLILLLVTNGVDIKNIAEILKVIPVSNGGSSLSIFSGNTQNESVKQSDIELLTKMAELSK